MRRDSSSARESSLSGNFIDRRFMKMALRQAEFAADRGEVPVGALITDRDGRVLSFAHNERETLKDPTAHAEILAIRRAAHTAGGWRLCGAVLYVTLEPCMMCMGAAVNSRIGSVVFGAYDPESTAFESGCRANNAPGYRGGVMEKECSDLLRRFFRDLRPERIGL